MAADNHRITLAQAIDYTHTWQKENPEARRAWMLPRPPFCSSASPLQSTGSK